MSCVLRRPDFCIDTFSGTLGGTTIVNMGNDNKTTNVSLEELSEEQKQLVEKTTNDFRTKCLESFRKTHGNVHQKFAMPQIVLSGQRQEDTEAEK